MPDLFLRCPRCNGRLRLRAQHAGRQGRCPTPACGASFTVPPAWLFTHFPGREFTQEQLEQTLTSTVPFTCSCGKTLRLRLEHAGKAGRCPACQASIRVPPPDDFLSRATHAAPAAPVTAQQTTPQQVTPLWQPGVIVDGRYEVKRKLGEGTFGAVWHVQLLEGHIDLAVKEVRADRQHSQSHQEKFVREALVWCDLDEHPNVVSARFVRTDLPGAEGSAFLFLEYCEGGCLADWIDQGRTRDLATALDVGIQLCWGLAHCHGKNTIHRDFKPLNVMMTGVDQPKITDFGTVKFAALEDTTEGDAALTDLRRTLGGQLQGTPPYMPPEQWVRGGQVDASVDLYALGVTLFEMLTGDFPIRAMEGGLAGWIQAHTQDTPVALRALRPDAPEALEALIQRCLAKKPGDRPGSAREVAQALTALHAQVTEQPHREEPAAAELLAGSHNNKGFSKYQMALAQGPGKEKERDRLFVEAEQEWQKAIQADSYHPAATYNLGLVRWRSVQTSDEDLLRALGEASATRPNEGRYVRALAHIERGDCASAIELLEAIEPGSGRREEAQRLLAWAKQHLGDSRQLVSTFQLWTPVTAVALSGDGRLALAGGWDGRLQLWEVSTGRQLGTLERHTRMVKAVALSADGRLALSSGDDRKLKLWEVSSGSCLSTLEGHTDSVDVVTFSSDGRVALSSGDDGSMRLWEVSSGGCLRVFDVQDRVCAAALSGDGRLALSGSYRKMQLWDVSNGKCLRTVEGPGEVVRAVALSGDGRLALAHAEKKVPSLWDLTSGTCLRTFLGHREALKGVALSSDGRLALSGSEDRTVKLWDTTSGRCLRTFEQHRSYVNAVALSADGRLALSGSNDETVLAWQTAPSWKAPGPLVLDQEQPRGLHQAQAGHEQALREAEAALVRGEPLQAARLTRSARAHPGYEYSPPVVDLWSRLHLRLGRGPWRAGRKLHTLTGHTGEVHAVALSADGRLALSGSYDSTLKLWEVSTGRCLRTLEHPSEAFTVALSGDGRLALSGDYRKVHAWDLNSGQRLRTLEGHTDSVREVALSSDGRLALSGSNDGTMRLWEVGTGRCLREFQKHPDWVLAVALSSDGRLALSGGGDHRMRLWEVSTGRCLHSFKHENCVNGVCLRSDARGALAGADADVDLWDLSKSRHVRTFKGHRLSVNTVALSPDGQLALSGGWDKTVKLWEVSSGQCLRSFEGHTSEVTAVALSASCQLALSASKDHTLIVWFLDWELADNEPADWDEGARSVLEVFLSSHTPYLAELPVGREPTETELTQALTRGGRPAWNDEDFQQLLDALGRAGYGWLRPEGVRKELETMAATWQGPPPLPAGTS